MLEAKRRSHWYIPGHVFNLKHPVTHLVTISMFHFYGNIWSYYLLILKSVGKKIVIFLINLNKTYKGILKSKKSIQLCFKVLSDLGWWIQIKCCNHHFILGKSFSKLFEKISDMYCAKDFSGCLNWKKANLMDIRKRNQLIFDAKFHSLINNLGWEASASFKEIISNFFNDKNQNTKIWRKLPVK